MVCKKNKESRTEMLKELEEEDNEISKEKMKRKKVEVSCFMKAIRVFYLDRYTYLNTYFPNTSDTKVDYI